MTNNLSVSIYAPYSTSNRGDSTDILGNVTIESFTSFFPGGLYGSATIRIPRDVTESFLFTGGDRVAIRNGLTIVWEGEIAGLRYGVGAGADQAITLECAGWWQQLLGKNTIDRRWCDTRIGPDAWKVDHSATATAKDHMNQKYDRSFDAAELHIEVKNEDISAGQLAAYQYQMPFGETVGRVSGAYSMDEGSGGTKSFTTRLQNRTDPTSFFTVSTDTTDATFDADESGTLARSIFLEFVADGNYTATRGDDFFGSLGCDSNGDNCVKVYRYKSSDATVPEVYMDNLCKDAQGSVSNINSDTANIDAATGNLLLLEPFMTDGQEEWSSVLTRAAAYGDAAFNEWYIRLEDSEKAASPDGKPVLFCKQYTDLASHDIAIRVDESNLLPPFTMVRDFDSIANWITVEYKSIDGSGSLVIETPDETAALTDTDSVATYGRRALALSQIFADATQARAFAQKVLAARKDPQWYISGPISVVGSIRTASGTRLPTSEIKAGMRIKIENFLQDLSPTGATGAGLTFRVTGTNYTDNNEVCQISTGVPDNLATMLAQMDFVLG